MERVGLGFGLAPPPLLLTAVFLIMLLLPLPPPNMSVMDISGTGAKMLWA